MGNCSSNKKKTDTYKTLNTKKTLDINQRIKFKIQDFVSENPNGLLSEYDLQIQIGKGGYGEVWKAVHNKSQRLRAIKIIKKADLSLIDRKKLFDEIEILKKLDHHSIVRIFEYFESEISIQIVMNFINGSELFEKISSNKSLYNEQTIRNVLKQLFGVINYVHSQNIIHGDLKSENILFDGKSITLIDFGIAKTLNKNILDQQIKGTLLYMAPEIFKKQQCFKSDIWACGIILYILFTGEPPFDLQKEKSIFIQQILNLQFKIPINKITHISKEGLKLLHNLLQKDPKNRPTASEALQFDWFNQDKLPLKESFVNQMEKTAKNLAGLQFQSKLQKAIFLYILNYDLDNNDLKQTADIFKEMDTNNDGFLSFEELKNGFANIGYTMSDQQLQELFKQVDTDGNGQVTFSEFITAAIDKNKMLTEKKIINIFKQFDQDKSGKISLQEFEAVLGKNSQLGDLRPLIEEIDINGDGEIDYQEFKILLKNISKHIVIQLINIINTTVDSIKQVNKLHQQKLSKELLSELLDFKDSLMKELAENYQDDSNQNSEQLNKKMYQLQHLKQSYLKAFQDYNNEMTQLQIQNQELKKKLENLTK